MKRRLLNADIIFVAATLVRRLYHQASRNHWGVENSLHWALDMVFREDEYRVRKGNGAENLARLRHFALNMLKQDKTTKLGIKNKRLKTGCSNDYLLQPLNIKL